MKILFVSSGNSRKGISPIIKRQGESLVKEGIDIQYFTIRGKGFRGYLSNLLKLKQEIKQLNPDIIHAHYSLSGILASLSASLPLVISLMGSDVKAKKWFRLFISFFYKFFWTKTIVKSEDMKNSLEFSNVSVIPNGVNIESFSPISKEKCQDKLGWKKEEIHILFAANPRRFEKNCKLAEVAVSKLQTKNIELHTLINVLPEEMPIWMNAADLILLTSLWEGSPNVIKEAMACNRPIVATNVGDIEWLFGSEEGHYLTNFEPDDVADKILQAIEFSVKRRATIGSERIKELELDSQSIAKRIIEVYNTVLSKNNRNTNEQGDNN